MLFIIYFHSKMHGPYNIKKIDMFISMQINGTNFIPKYGRFLLKISIYRIW
jgi:hypothetical protein